MKMMSDRWFFAFKVRIPRFPDRRLVSDEEVRQRMEPILKNMRVKPRVDLLSKMMSGGLNHGKIYTPDKGKKPASRPDYGANIWKEFMISILEHPEWPKTQRQKAMSLTKWEYEKLESDLAKSGLIKLHKISFGRRGDSSVYVELLPEGFAYLNIQYQALKGKGSYAHKMAQYKLSKVLERDLAN